METMENILNYVRVTMKAPSVNTVFPELAGREVIFFIGEEIYNNEIKDVEENSSFGRHLLYSDLAIVVGENGNSSKTIKCRW